MTASFQTSHRTITNFSCYFQGIACRRHLVLFADDHQCFDADILCQTQGIGKFVAGFQIIVENTV